MVKVTYTNEYVCVTPLKEGTTKITISNELVKKKSVMSFRMIVIIQMMITTQTITVIQMMIMIRININLQKMKTIQKIIMMIHIKGFRKI